MVLISIKKIIIPIKNISKITKIPFKIFKPQLINYNSKNNTLNLLLSINYPISLTPQIKTLKLMFYSALR